MKSLLAVYVALFERWMEAWILYVSLCVCLSPPNCLGNRMHTCPGVSSHCVVAYCCPMFKTIAAALKQNPVWAKRAQWSKMQRKTHFPFIFLLCVVFVLECIFIAPLALIQLCFYGVFICANHMNQDDARELVYSLLQWISDLKVYFCHECVWVKRVELRFVC